MSFVKDAEAEKALHWLTDSARALGEAKKQAVLTESMRKRVRAIEMARSEAKTVADREREAEASEAYLRAIQEEAEAAGQYEYLRALKDAATARIECWRSINASARNLRAA